ncbi:sigma 54-interacting transcriptional regulator, partial [Petrachloros mirabilis]
TDLKVDVRVVAATNRDLESLVEKKRFRSDLYYRLNVIEIDIPPLRERLDDFSELADVFLKRYGERAGKTFRGLTQEALSLCLKYKWPGNVRELENMMERAVTLAPPISHWITPDVLSPAIRDSASPDVPSLDVMDFVKRLHWPVLLQTLKQSGSLSNLLDQVEWAITSRAVTEYGGNKTAAARLLGRTYRWLRKLESKMTDN